MVITVVYGVLAVICLGYFAGIVIYTQTVGFALFWLLTGLLLCAAGAYCAYRRKHPDRLEMPLMLKSAVFTCVSVGFLILAAAGITIFMDTEEEAPEDLDYLIVLGSKTVGREPSDTLKLRLDAALEYLQENKKTRVILSGGKGSGEDWTEAQVMYLYLKNAGVQTHRMVMETQSTDTEENVIYSLNLVKKTDTVGIVTNDFHLCRAQALARKQGKTEVYGIPAKSNWFLLPNQTVRECFALLIEKFMGNI
ncbi:YdcF family protein [Cuneatibacter caecimuris]|uniref:Uncharacterized SAM-binding protein YcdF (DUF218 family) n=1 Tax=Cuneatibacter caecimuris TaxID=1796618 RepID=A0A4Q7PNT3_9FIRM|nr:YdcF family protein [Cuneatibacter caecimuris]RZT02639.1 uncharacterized SAM-binding protein YcdF (DUF218 family) [Cuneatibacter caecimuris]